MNADRNPPLPLRLISDEGVFVVSDAAVPLTERDARARYVGWWLGADDPQVYVYSALVYHSYSAVEAMIDLSEQFGVDLGALTADSPAAMTKQLVRELERREAVRLREGGLGGKVVALPWIPATRDTVLALMGFRAAPDRETGLIGADVNIVSPCAPPDHDPQLLFAGPTQPGHRGATSALGAILEALILADPCPPGGGGGSCLCCPVAGALGAEGSAADGAGTVAACCGASGACNDCDPCTTNDNCSMEACPDRPAFTCCGAPKVCADDGNVCTNDHCVNGFCVKTPLNCNDGLLCTIDGCAPTTGCTHTPKNCDDGDACTADSCDPSTGACRNPQSCSPNKCCPADSGSFCCQHPADVCCSNPDHCCDAGKTCCAGGTECCAADETCCNTHCGKTGACCFFDSGSCSELTSLCCQQQGGTYQGDGTTCSPGDLCRPKCENCHAVNSTFYECGHYTENPSEPCDQNRCVVDIPFAPLHTTGWGSKSAGVLHDLAIGNRIDGHGLLQQTVEQLPSTA